MFVDKLRKEDIEEFLRDYLNGSKLRTFHVIDGRGYGEFGIEIFYSKPYTFGEGYIDKVICFGEMTCLDPHMNWIKFLYKKFGNEYKQWYLKQLTTIFD